MLSKAKSMFLSFAALLTVIMMGTTTNAIAANASDFGAGKAQQQYGAGANLKSVSNNATNSFEMVWIVLCSGATLVGLGLAFAGFMRLRKSQDQSSGVTAGSGWIMIGIGGCLAVLPWILFTASNTITTAG
ncbi:TPA: hypothetical protein ACGIK9_003430 [Acinetobacter baumannii]|uniref:hypothetical protein n=1 Tax=Acinetobacter baumannii TaxID=470 RepID=UPI00338FA7CE